MKRRLRPPSSLHPRSRLRLPQLVPLQLPVGSGGPLVAIGRREVRDEVALPGVLRCRGGAEGVEVVLHLLGAREEELPELPTDQNTVSRL